MRQRVCMPDLTGQGVCGPNAAGTIPLLISDVLLVSGCVPKYSPSLGPQDKSCKAAMCQAPSCIVLFCTLTRPLFRRVGLLLLLGAGCAFCQAPRWLLTWPRKALWPPVMQSLRDMVAACMRCRVLNAMMAHNAPQDPVYKTSFTCMALSIDHCW